MKRKFLKEDVERILEVMGIDSSKKNLILEQNKFRKLLSFIKDKLDFRVEDVVSRSGSREPQYFIGNQKVEKSLFDDLNDLVNTEFNDAQDFDRLYNELFVTGKLGETSSTVGLRRTMLKNLLGDEYKKLLYNDVIGELIRTRQLKNEASFYKLLLNKKKANNGLLNIRNELNNMGFSDPLDQDILTSKIQKKLKDIEDNPGKPFETEVTRPILTNVSALTKREISWLNNVLGTRSTYFTHLGKVWKGDFDSLVDEILAYSKKFEESLSSLPAKTDEKYIEQLQTLSNAYAIKIANRINAVKIRFGDDAIEVLEDYGINPELMQKLKTDPDTFFKIFRENLYEAPPGFLQTLEDSVSVLLSSFVELSKNILKGALGKAMKNIINPNTPLGNWFWTSHWGGFNTLYGLLVKHGFHKDTNKFKLFLSMFAWTAIARIIGGIVMGTIKTVWEFIIKPIWERLKGWACDAWTYWFGESKWCDELEQINLEKIGKGYFTEFGIYWATKVVDSVVSDLEKRTGLSIATTFTPVIGMVKGFLENIPFSLLYELKPEFTRPFDDRTEQDFNKLKEELRKKGEPVDSIKIEF